MELELVLGIVGGEAVVVVGESWDWNSDCEKVGFGESWGGN